MAKLNLDKISMRLSDDSSAVINIKGEVRQGMSFTSLWIATQVEKLWQKKKAEK